MTELNHLKNAVSESVTACKDPDLLDLVYKLLVFEDVKGR